MKKYLPLVKIVLGLTSISLGLGYSCYLQFTNIDMTEMRLFVTFWPQLSLNFIAVIIGVLLLRD
jgi:hypothetical protein